MKLGEVASDFQAFNPSRPNSGRREIYQLKFVFS